MPSAQIDFCGGHSSDPRRMAAAQHPRPPPAIVQYLGLICDSYEIPNRRSDDEIYTADRLNCRTRCAQSMPDCWAGTMATRPRSTRWNPGSKRRKWPRSLAVHRSSRSRWKRHWKTKTTSGRWSCRTTLKWLEDGDRQLARKVKVAALRALAAREYNAPNRNYYLSYANELESGQLSEVWF